MKNANSTGYEEISLLDLSAIYHERLENGTITDQDRQMYQHCLAALQRIYARRKLEKEMQNTIGGWRKKGLITEAALKTASEFTQEEIDAISGETNPKL